MKNKQTLENGFSIVELLVVLVIISVMAGISAYFFNAHQKLYKPDDQSLKIIDILQEARQRALTQRETIRVEINSTLNIARVIDENTPSTANDDKEVRRVALFGTNEVAITSRPNNIGYNPPRKFACAECCFFAEQLSDKQFAKCLHNPISKQWKCIKCRKRCHWNRLNSNGRNFAHLVSNGRRNQQCRYCACHYDYRFFGFSAAVGI